MPDDTEEVTGHAKPLQEHPDRSRGWTTPVIASLVLGLVALILAAWPLIRPMFDSSQSESEATTKLCTAYDLAFRGVKLQTNQGAPEGPAGPLAAAANARLSLVVASNNLLAAIDDSPEAPDGLKDSARKLANSYTTVVSNYLAGEQTDSAPIRAAFDSAGSAAKSLDEGCKK